MREQTEKELLWRMRKPVRKKNGSNDFFFRLTLLQLAVCALLIAAVFLTAKQNGDLFRRLRAEFVRLTAADYDLEEITFFPRQTEAGTDPAPDGATQESAPAETAAQTQPAAEEPAVLPDAAGGEDITDADALRLVSFQCYACGDTPVLPVSGRVTSEFGERVHPVYGTVSFHSGKDIAAPEGSPVYAALDGEVIGAGWGDMSGNYVKLRHENGLETLYCHCSRLNVETGVSVRKGDVIAFVGQTGLATGPHLHFEVHIDGVKRNPDFLLENACSVA